MSAFGRKNGVGGMAPGARPSFGVAKPMKGGVPIGGQPAPPASGGEQFPPLPGEMDAAPPPANGAGGRNADAMSRLADRSNAATGSGNYGVNVEGDQARITAGSSLTISGTAGGTAGAVTGGDNTGVRVDGMSGTATPCSAPAAKRSRNNLSRPV